MAVLKICMFLLMMATIVELAKGTYYIVGGSSTWNLGVDYNQWVSGKSFHPGDILGFLYSGSEHDVLQVTSNSYNQCQNSDPISSDNSGNTTIVLNDIGTQHFICGIGNHCNSGMKVQISVVSAGPSGSPSPAADSLCKAVKPALALVLAIFLMFVVI